MSRSLRSLLEFGFAELGRLTQLSADPALPVGTDSRQATAARVEAR